mmetsp:Transcript_46281/g.116073  ORF Transcript_46281/g.116073 Transcript_46281/m.116073 type:complete len:220 (-) Transcript_46281:520-1179(-)
MYSTRGGRLPRRLPSTWICCGDIAACCSMQVGFPGTRGSQPAAGGTCVAGSQCYICCGVIVTCCFSCPWKSSFQHTTCPFSADPASVVPVRFQPTLQKATGDCPSPAVSTTGRSTASTLRSCHPWSEGSLNTCTVDPTATAMRWCCLPMVGAQSTSRTSQKAPLGSGSRSSLVMLLHLCCSLLYPHTPTELTLGSDARHHPTTRVGPSTLLLFQLTQLT